MSHVAQSAEYDKSGYETRQAVNAARENGISVAVIVELVVGTECEKSSESRAERKEYLGSCIYPDLPREIKSRDGD